MSDSAADTPAEHFAKARDLANKDMDALLISADEDGGFCLECGEESEDDMEPDARRLCCTTCRSDAVYAAEEIILMAGW